MFEQYTDVLQALAAQQPLMLVVDDLQWADAASIGLLFRLGRRIGERPSDGEYTICPRSVMLDASPLTPVLFCGILMLYKQVYNIAGRRGYGARIKYQ